MSDSIADVSLHPIRLRIARALAPSREATIGELAASMPDVPPATLYRHVNELAKASLIDIVAERAVRGATEPYRIARTGSSVGHLGDATRADRLRSFITFVTTTIDDFAAYLDRGRPDDVRDGIGYRRAVLDLTDATVMSAVSRETARRP